MAPYKILNQSFLGNNLRKDTTYLIIGAGISGLLLGFYLKKAGFSFVIAEKTDRAGGLLQTHSHSCGISEYAANGFLWCEEMQEVATDLGLTLLAPKPTARARYLLRKRQLRRFPLGFGETLGMLAKIFFGPRKNFRTVEQFGHAHLGKNATRRILEPALAGIFAANINTLSFPGATSSLAKKLNVHSNLLMALWKTRQKKQTVPSGTHSFLGGMGSLSEGLAHYLEPEIMYRTDGHQLKKDYSNLILTLPADQAASFFDGRMLSLLSQVEYTPVISATLFIKKESFRRFKEGFGVLIPRSEGLLSLGVLFNDSIFEGRVNDPSIRSLTCILRDDTADQKWMQASQEQLIDHLSTEIDDIFGLKEGPVFSTIQKWPRGIPVYSPELYHSWFEMQELLVKDFPNINLFANYTGQISIRGLCQEAAKITLGYR